MKPRMSVARCCCGAGVPIVKPYYALGSVNWDNYSSPTRHGVLQPVAGMYIDKTPAGGASGHGTAFIFSNVAVAPGTTVSAAYLRFNSGWTGTHAFGMNIDIVADLTARTPAAPAWGPIHETNLGAERYDWDQTGIPWSGASVVTDNIKTVVNEIFAAPTWTYGNYLSILFEVMTVTGPGYLRSVMLDTELTLYT